MNDLQKTGSELSPLDQIRQIETDIAAQIAAARVSAGRSIANARSQAIGIKNQAQEAGLQAGRERYQEIIEQAEREATVITEEARSKADAMRERGHQLMEEAVLLAYHLVIGQEEDRGKT